MSLKKIDSKEFDNSNTQELAEILKNETSLEFYRCSFNLLDMKIFDNNSSIKFKKCVFTNCNFEYLTLFNKTFKTCSILQSKFFRMDLEDVEVNRCIIRRCDFERVNVLSWVTIAATALKDCNIKSIKCYGETSAIVGNLFSDCDVKEVGFYQGNFSLNELSNVTVDATSMRSIETRSNGNKFKNSEENDYSKTIVSLKGE